MKALSLSAPRKFDVIDLPEPAEPGPYEALVRIHAVGVCGTDISGYLGKMPFIEHPRILGHELGVEVVAVGDEVTEVKPGDRCAVEPYLNCGECHACARGHTNCCENLKVLGVHTDGGLRPLLVLPADKLHPAEGLSYEQLALVETLGIGCHAVNRVCPHADETVLVLGAGHIGLSVMEFVRLTGAKLHVIEPDETRREFVSQNFPKAKVHAPLEPDAFFQHNEGRGADIVFDATGNADSMARSFEYAAFAGALVWVGITAKTVPFDDALFHRRELTLLASRNAIPSDFNRILRLMKEGHLDTTPWVTHRATFDEAAKKFASWSKPGSGVVKAIVTVQ